MFRGWGKKQSPGGNSSSNASKLASKTQQKFSRGIDCNMKIVIRGDKNTGKSSLFKRLQNQPLGEYHETEQIEVANISWKYKNTAGVVKVEIWDVVDQATKPVSGFALEDGVMPRLDASFVDVYKGTHGAVLMYDMTKKWTYEYVQREVPKISPSIPILILANYRDCTAERKRVVSADEVISFIEEQKRPVNSQPILYCEASLKHDFGLMFVHKFFGMVFLAVQRQWHEEQLRANQREAQELKKELEDAGPESGVQDYDQYMIRREQRRKQQQEEPTFAVKSKSSNATPVISPLTSNNASRTSTPPPSQSLNASSRSEPEKRPGSSGSTGGLFSRMRSSFSFKRGGSGNDTKASTKSESVTDDSNQIDETKPVTDVDEFIPEEALPDDFFGDDDPSPQRNDDHDATVEEQVQEAVEEDMPENAMIEEDDDEISITPVVADDDDDDFEDYGNSLVMDDDDEISFDEMPEEDKEDMIISDDDEVDPSPLVADDDDDIEFEPTTTTVDSTDEQKHDEPLENQQNQDINDSQTSGPSSQETMKIEHVAEPAVDSSSEDDDDDDVIIGSSEEDFPSDDNDSDHKPDKHTSKHTQKKHKDFSEANDEDIEDSVFDIDPLGGDVDADAFFNSLTVSYPTPGQHNANSVYLGHEHEENVDESSSTKKKKKKKKKKHDNEAEGEHHQSKHDNGEELYKKKKKKKSKSTGSSQDDVDAKKKKKKKKKQPESAEVYESLA